MAALRIKLIFDGIDVKKCMFLVDASHVVIKDLERKIKKRFNIQKACNLYLLIDDFVLHSEDSIELIHDNDIVIVRVEESEEPELENTGTVRKKSKKRKRKSSRVNEQEISEDEQSVLHDRSSEESKKHKLKKVCQKYEVVDNEGTKNQMNKKKNHKQNKSKMCGNVSILRSQADCSHPHNENKSNIEVKTSNKEKLKNSDIKTGTSKKKSSDDSSSSSDEDQMKKTVVKLNSDIKQTLDLTRNKQNDDEKLKSEISGNSQRMKVKVRKVTEVGETKHIFFESESENSNCDDDAAGKDNHEENRIGCDSTKNRLTNEDKEEAKKEDEGTLVTDIQEKPLEMLAKPPTPPIRDYSKLQPLIGPPRAGDVIGYKILELSPNYMPEISAYKEGRVVEYDVTSQYVTIELCEGFTTHENIKREGRFEMEMDEEFIVDNAQNEKKVCIQWSAVMAPRLITSEDIHLINHQTIATTEAIQTTASYNQCI